MEFDKTNQRLLNLLQRNFPLTERPFREIGTALGIGEDEVLKRLEGLLRGEYVRFIGAIVNTASLGFESALVSFSVDPERISRVAEIVNAHPGVSHNYERNDMYNLWFTIAVPGDIDLQGTVDLLRRLSGVEVFLFLPALKTYKIGVILDAFEGNTRLTVLLDPVKGGLSEPIPQSRSSLSINKKESITPYQRTALFHLQNGIPLIREPFNRLALKTGSTPLEFLHVVRGLLDKGVIRRFGAVPNHRKMGYTCNIMAVWEVPEEIIDECGSRIASFIAVTHCYQRPVFRDWPYSLYTMIHCRSEEECSRIVMDVRDITGCDNYRLLSSVREFKRVRLKYFSEDFYRWRREHCRPS